MCFSMHFHHLLFFSPTGSKEAKEAEKYDVQEEMIECAAYGETGHNIYDTPD